MVGESIVQKNIGKGKIKLKGTWLVFLFIILTLIFLLLAKFVLPKIFVTLSTDRGDVALIRGDIL